MQCDGVGNLSSLAHCKPGGGVWGAAAPELRTRASWYFPAWPVLFCKALGGFLHLQVFKFHQDL